MPVLSLFLLVNLWDIMSDSLQADVIIQVTWLVIGGVDKALDTFKSYRVRPASTPADELNMETLNESLTEEIKKNTVPLGHEEAAKRLERSGNLPRGFSAILAIGLVIAILLSLANNGNSLSDPGKVLGAVLAVAVINFFTGTKPPPDPIANFIEDEAHGPIASFDTAPDPQLSYFISNANATAGQGRTITTKLENKSSEDVAVSNHYPLVEDTSFDKGSNGHTCVTPASTTAAQLASPARLGSTSAYYEYVFHAAGPPDTTTKLLQLVVKAGRYVESIWTGKVNAKGDSDNSSISWVEIVENGLKDRCQVQFPL
ncbi:hypothetical protein BP00DRAFT_451728 [Aspergillus indologenus CBS 114.80]|uniref:Uncharacterized protein n=1 Tax=Aspergillus indologenus CBS 114.80 TaxID=1450541 RepID=A0A2V5HUV7_9EURO|nr:hypothetical protein BP00DRAFT_451728 [Aspergillus indologenus CBS 114.80]